MSEKEPSIEIDENDLGRELSMQAGYYLYFAEQAIRAEAVYNTTKYSCDQVLAQADTEIRLKAEEDKRKLTEKLIEKEIDLIPAVREARIRLIKAKAEMDMKKARREAWYQRKDLVVQMAIKQRGDVDAIVNSRVKSATV
jgi:hypothetical protein